MATSTDFVPHINWIEPPEERDQGRHLSTQLHMLQYYEGQFRSAIELIENVEHLMSGTETLGARARISNWINISAHYAVLTIYHFRSTIFSIQSSIGRCPTHSQKIDTKLIDDALQRFLREFPFCVKIRDGSAHFADKIRSPEKIESAKTPEGPFIHGAMTGRTITFTANKQYISLDVSEENLEKLQSIKREVYEAFRKLSA